MKPSKNLCSMEAKELMIGDLVNLSKGNWSENRQVELIDIEMVAEGVYLAEPIPITTEILEKNGWVYNNEDEKFFPQTWVGGGLMLQGADDCGYRVVVTSDYDDEDTNNTPFIILYIHELQHALRLRRIEKEIIL